MFEIVFDTETTGLDPSTERVFEIGMVELENRIPTGRVFHKLLNPKQPLSEASTRITGFTDADLVDKPSFEDIVEDLLAFMSTHTLVAHNASFDMGFLNAELTRLNQPTLTNEVVDTLAIARQKLPGARHSLDALCRRYAIDLTERTAHNALLDTHLLVDVYTELMGGLQGNILDALEDDSPIGGLYGAKAKALPQSTLKRTLLETPPTETEKNAHSAFLKKYL